MGCVLKGLMLLSSLLFFVDLVLAVFAITVDGIFFFVVITSVVLDVIVVVVFVVAFTVVFANPVFVVVVEVTVVFVVTVIVVYVVIAVNVVFVDVLVILAVFVSCSLLPSKVNLIKYILFNVPFFCTRGVIHFGVNYYFFQMFPLCKKEIIIGNKPLLMYIL